MGFRASEVESDNEIKLLGRKFILGRICEKYRLQGDSEFDPEEMEKSLKEFDKRFLRSNINDILEGWDLIKFTEEGFTLSLNEDGIRHCQEKEPEKKK